MRSASGPSSAISSCAAALRRNGGTESGSVRIAAPLTMR